MTRFYQKAIFSLLAHAEYNSNDFKLSYQISKIVRQ